MNIVLDTNSLIMSIAPKSPYRSVIRKDPHYSFGLMEADKDDNKFVDCAIAANAKCIVTEDNHFNILKTIPFPKVEVIGIDDFKMYLNRWLN